MGGLVLDIFIVYLFRVLIRAWRRLGTSEWELRKATVASVSCPPIAWGCPIVEVVYLYKIDEMTYSGSANIPFIWRSSANEYARKHPQESILEVRVKPGDPEISVMRAEDQARAVAQLGDVRHAAHGR
jgi:hypothetical protein